VRGILCAIVSQSGGSFHDMRFRNQRDRRYSDAADYLRKPIEPKRFVTRVKAALRRAVA